LRSIEEITKIVEIKATEKYGSINKMLIQNNINKSIIGNMKRTKPSIPNIIDFCKLAEAIDVSVDYLLNTISDDSILSFDERWVIDSYRELNDEGKYIIQDTTKKVWAKHCEHSLQNISISQLLNDSNID